MAKIMCYIDTEKCTMELTKDGEAINHDDFVAGSYFSDNMDGGTPSSYFPGQFSYFSYSKKMEDGNINSMYGSFQVGKEGSYAEHNTTLNVAKSCTQLTLQASASISLGEALAACKLIKRDKAKQTIPIIDPNTGDITQK